MFSKKIARVLMCRPTYFSVDYVINPWMKPGSVDKKRALEQWNTLVKTYQSLNITVEIIEQVQGLPDMVFAADQGIINGNKILLSNFRYKERQRESQYYQTWFENHGFEILKIRHDDFFEGGGECLPWRNTYFIGTGFRSIPESIPWMEQRLGKQFVQLKLINKFFYHLDTCLLPINDDTIFYYPKAFSDEAIAILRGSVSNLIPFTKAEAYNFCSNAVVTGNHIVTQPGSESFKKKMEKLHYVVHEVDVSEFIKSGGGIHCLTNILEYY